MFFSKKLVIVAGLLGMAFLVFFANLLLVIPSAEQELLDPRVYHVPGSTYERGLDLIFVADGYLSQSEFESDAATLLGELRTYEPWKSFDRYNLQYVRPREIDLCGIKTENERHPVLRCDAERLNSYLNKITVNGPFKAIILSRRSFESWANVVRLENSGIFFSLPVSPATPPDRFSAGVQFAHLMGHAFGLKDEELFVIAKVGSAGTRPDGPNCAPDKTTAERWWGSLAASDPRIGYFEGCAGKKEYIKPTESSLMNLNELGAFVPEYGTVSEHYLRTVLRYCFSKDILGISAPDAAFFERYPEFKSCVE